jgi:hypothetical protein
VEAYICSEVKYSEICDAPIADDFFVQSIQASEVSRPLQHIFFDLQLAESASQVHRICKLEVLTMSNDINSAHENAFSETRDSSLLDHADMNTAEQLPSHVRTFRILGTGKCRPLFDADL